MRLRIFVILLLIIFLVAIISITLATYFLAGTATPKAVVASVLS